MHNTNNVEIELFTNKFKAASPTVLMKLQLKLKNIINNSVTSCVS